MGMGNNGHHFEDQQDLNLFENLWSQGKKLDETDKFLKDYILKKG